MATDYQHNDESHLAQMRGHARTMFADAVAAADPRAAVVRTLHKQPNSSQIQSTAKPQSFQLQEFSRRKVRVVAFGKAAITMTEGALECVPEDLLIEAPVAVTSYENVIQHGKIQILGAGHPIPNADGLKAARKIAKTVRAAKADELILALISGGASALLPMPPPSITLEDKRNATQLLLTSGADIHEINTVRKHLSELKGGGLARLAYPAALQVLILSDVLDNDPGTIASGPTAGDLTTFSDAKGVFLRRGIWEQIPNSIQAHLDRGCDGLIDETTLPEDEIFRDVSNTIVGSNLISLDSICQSAKSAGYDVQIVSKALMGEARSVAEKFLMRASAPIERPTAFVAGGETTVTVRGSGLGGRNQEMALTFAIDADSRFNNLSWVFLSGGTDGIDGPTDAAGGLVDPGTIARIHNAGYDPRLLLDNNDAYHALDHAGDLLVTGATGTNVADLQILLIHPG
ncbi:MAG TPA: glycerate kinase [Gammaproteobacteria bacterium]|nr:glycerate kinase [Gammaproteobacteria bacterium]|tara:strand:- start:4881 stop:6260 length:1380 start_codon:yes stop_codon:yes gene_type:complete